MNLYQQGLYATYTEKARRKRRIYWLLKIAKILAFIGFSYVACKGLYDYIRDDTAPGSLIIDVLLGIDCAVIMVISVIVGETRRNRHASAMGEIDADRDRATKMLNESVELLDNLRDLNARFHQNQLNSIIRNGQKLDDFLDELGSSQGASTTLISDSGSSRTPKTGLATTRNQVPPVKIDICKIPPESMPVASVGLIGDVPPGLTVRVIADGPDGNAIL